MKKLYTLVIIAFIASLFNFSYSEVSKTPQKKTVVLEEFTGIHCGYCTDGHKRATDLANANKNKVFLINIHAGSYAVPGAGEVDLRTSDGTKLDAQAGAPSAGYPCGSVNRNQSPWVMNRGLWASKAQALLNENSPVNVDVLASVDETTRELKVDVEYYYTSDSPASSNNLYIVLLQDSILGTQSDYGNYNPTNWTKDGKYIHNHVFRMLINKNGTTGEPITNPKTGSTEKRSYTTTLPLKIGNVNIALKQLKIVAFVAESAAKIYSAAETHVGWPNTVDLALKDLTVVPTDICTSEISPKVEVTNNSDKEITSFSVTCKIFDKTVVKDFTGSLKKGDKTTIDFGLIKFTPKGVSTYQIIGFSQINYNALEDYIGSNNTSVVPVMYLGKKAFTEYSAGYNSATDFPENTAFDKSQNAGFGIYKTTASSGANSSACGILFYLHSSNGVANKPGRILFGEADLTSANKPTLSYWYAYTDGGLGGTAPTLTMEYSEDCGTTWKTINTTVCVETGQPADPQYLYVPTSSEYKKVTMDVSSLKSKSVIFRFSGIPGTSGNALFVDEFELSDVGGPSITTDLTTFDFGNVKLGSKKSKDITITNDGTTNLNITSIACDELKDVFVIKNGPGTNPLVVAPKGKHTFTIEFVPTAELSYSDFITITSNAKNTPLLVMAVDGKGEKIIGDVNDYTSSDNRINLDVKPSLINNSANVSLNLKNITGVDVKLFDSNGQLVKVIASGLADGTSDIQLTTSELTSGKYFVIANSGNTSAKVPVIIVK
jgi:hypothetical protein